MSESASPSTGPPSPPPPLDSAAHKGTAGRLLCLAGSATMPGAATLVVRAAQRAGAGLVTLGIFQSELLAIVAAQSPETIFLDVTRSKDLFASRLPAEIAGHDHHVRLAGPGLGQGGHMRQLVRSLAEDAEFDGPLVLDADALNVLAGAPEVLCSCQGTAVVTPHPGEAARLLGSDRLPDDDEGRIGAARELAGVTGSMCVLKGRHTVVTDGERTWVNPTGNPGMATAGSGDVLAGILGAYLVASLRSEDWSVFDATCAAVYVHGLAGDLAAAELGERGVIASDLIGYLPHAQKRHSEAE